MLKKFFISIFALLLSCAAFAQHQVRVVMPNGDSAAYVPQHVRTHIQHDTVSKIEHDTLTFVKEAYYETHEVDHERLLPILVDVKVVMPRDTVFTVPKRTSSFGVFGYADFRGAAVAPSVKIDLDKIILWIYVGGYYVSDGRHIATWTAGLSAYAPMFKF
jgi:hypothetical protein